MTLMEKTNRSYFQLSRIEDFYARYEYLKIGGKVGESTFGSDRYINQKFYQSLEWKRIRDRVISRDGGFDMGHRDFPINGKIYVHHMNPMAIKDISDGNSDILDPMFLISVSHNTHNAIHYGDESLLPDVPLERLPNDTTPWRRT